MPPIKFYEKGQPREDVIRMYLANVRWKDLLYGDMMAQLGSIWTGRRRLVELASHYGNDETERYIEAIFDYADERMAAEIRAMPEGDYESDSWLDTDGQGGTNIHIHAKVSIRDDHVHMNFAGSAPQTPGANNSSFGVMQAASGIPILCMIDPTIPHNDGCLRHISAEAPLGSVCNAKYPASTALATIGSGDTMQFAVWKAMAHAVPDRIMAVNLTGATSICQAALGPMKASGKGAIVNIASAAGLRPLSDRAAYCASKAGLIMATKVLALDLAKDGIRANTVCPGATDTTLFRQYLGDATIEDVKTRYALNRIGAPSEVAAAILFLLSDEASLVTGSALAVDGGRVFH